MFIVPSWLDKLEEMDEYLEKYSSSKLNQEEIIWLDQSLQVKQSIIIIIKPPSKQKSRAKWLHWWILPNIQRTWTNPCSLFQKTEKERTLPKAFYETTIMLIPKPDKDTTKKENCKLMSLINVDAKILNQILANQIQQQIKWIIHHDHVEFISESQRWFNVYKVTWCTTSTKAKNCMITSINTEKGFEKIQHPFIIKTLTKVGIEGTYLNIIKAIYKKPMANIILNGEKLKALNLEQDKEAHFCHIYST